MATLYTPQKRDPYQLQNPQDAGQFTDTAMKADVLGQATSNPNTVIQGSQTGSTAVNGAIAPTAVNYQQVYQQNPVQNAPPVEKKQADIVSSQPANGYMSELQSKMNQAQADYLQVQNYGQQARGEVISDSSKQAYVSQLPPEDPNESSQEKDLRKVVQQGGAAGLSAGNALTQLTQLRKDRQKLDQQEGLVRDDMTAARNTELAAQFKSGQTGGSYAQATLAKFDEKQKMQQQQMQEDRQQFLNSAWDAALNNNYAMSEQFKKEAEKSLQGYLALRQDARAEKESVAKLQQYEDTHADNAATRAQNTLKNLIDNGIEIGDVPQAYFDQLDSSMGLPNGSAAAMWEVGQDDRKSKYITDQETLKTKQLENAQKLVSVLDKVPLGQSVKIGENTYYGNSRGDVKSGTEIDANGNATYWEFDPRSKSVQSYPLGAIGKAQDGWDTQIDDNGKMWFVNARTKQIQPGFPTQGQKDVDQAIPDGSVWYRGGKPAPECGQFVNDVCGAGVGDSFESKMAKTDKTIKADSENPPQYGDFFVQKMNTWTGHIGMVVGSEKGPDGETYIYTKESNYPQPGVISSRKIKASEINGFGRTGQISPALQNGPDSKKTAPAGDVGASSGGTPTFGGKEKTGTKPASIQEYEYAKGDGFTGTYEDWKKKSSGGDVSSPGLTEKQIGAIEKSPEAKQLLSLGDLKTKLQAYKDMVSASDGFQVMGSKKTALDSLYAELQVAWKEAANLGALTGPDLALIQAAVKPTSGASNFLDYKIGGGKEGVQSSIDTALKSLNQKGSKYTNLLQSKYSNVKDDPYLVNLTSAFAGEANAGKAESAKSKYNLDY